MASRTRRFTQVPRGPCLEMGADDRSSPNASRPHPWPCRVSPWSNDENGQAPYSLRPRITGPGLEWLRDAKSVRAAGGGGDKFFGQRPKALSGQGKGQVSVEDKPPFSLSVRRGCPPDTARWLAWGCARQLLLRVVPRMGLEFGVNHHEVWDIVCYLK